MPDEKIPAEAAAQKTARCRAYSWSDLTLYHMGELTPGEKREMRRHIGECRRCRILWGRARNSVETPVWCTPESAAEAYAREHAGMVPVKPNPERRRWFEFLLPAPQTLAAAMAVLLLGIAGVGIWRYIAQERRRIEVLEATARNPLNPLAPDLVLFDLPPTAAAGIPADWVIPSRMLIYGGFVAPVGGLPPLPEQGTPRGKRGNESGAREPVPEPVAPVRTAVSTLPPVFRWNEIKGGTLYVPRLNGAVFDPSNPPELKLGEQYQWTVETLVGGNLRISEPAYFRVLDEKRLAEVEGLRRKLAGSPLALAAMYESYGLLDDATAELGKLPGDSKRAKELIDNIRLRKKLP